MYVIAFLSIVPVVGVIALGGLLRHMRFLPETFFGQLNALMFWVLLPAMLFHDIAAAPRTAGPLGLKIAAALIVCVVLTAIPADLFARLFRMAPPSRRAFVQAAGRGNLAFTGLPVLLHAFGDQPEVTAAATFAIAPAVAFYNMFGVVVLTDPAKGGGRASFGRALLGIARNPLVIGCLLGILALFSGLTMPPVLMRLTAIVGQAALPCALLALGASLKFDHIRQLAAAAGSTAFKLLLSPAIGFFVASWFGLSGPMMTVVLLFLASPTAVASYVMADQMDADRDLAAAAIVLSTLLAFPVMAVLLAMSHAHA